MGRHPHPFGVVPTPVEGPLDQVSMWIRVLTRMDMDEDGVVSWIENSDWQELRRKLEAQGGPLPPDP